MGQSCAGSKFAQLKAGYPVKWHAYRAAPPVGNKSGRALSEFHGVRMTTQSTQRCREKEPAEPGLNEESFLKIPMKSVLGRTRIVRVRSET